jgi:hypothetical protein
VGTRTRRDATVGEVTALLSRCDSARLAAELSRLGVAGIGGPRLLALDRERLERPFALGLAAQGAAAKILGDRQRVATMGVLMALSVTGIPAVPLKGVLMAERLYGSASTRVSGDIDVLVAPSQLAGAVEVAVGLGYAAPSDRVGADGLPLLHFALAGDPVLELHWRVHWFEEQFAANALVRAEDGLRLRPADEFAMLLLFYARDGFTGLRQAADLAAWWDRYGNDAVLAAVRAIADEAPALSKALATAASAAASLTGVPDPWNGRGCVPRAKRLVNWRLDGSEDRWRADASLIDLLLAPRGGRVATLRRHMLVRLPEIEAWERPVAAGVGRRRIEQGLRPAKLLARWLRALARPGPRRAGRLTPLPKLLLAVEVVAVYAWVRWLLRSNDTPATAARLRRPPRRTRVTGAEPAEYGRHLAWATVRVLHRLPVDSRCLLQSLVLARLMTVRALDYAIVFSVGREETFEAHCWVEAGGVALLEPGGGSHVEIMRL